jgi:hypothetical protein
VLGIDKHGEAFLEAETAQIRVVAELVTTRIPLSAC